MVTKYTSIIYVVHFKDSPFKKCYLKSLKIIATNRVCVYVYMYV